MTRLDQAVLDSLQKKPLVVSVVGHTNHGKSSIIRSLIEKNTFGIVSPEPVAMREVQKYRLQENLSTVALLCDTPGLTFASEAVKTLGFHPNIDDIRKFYESQEKYAHERVVFEHLSRESSVILFVVDIRQPCRDDSKDESLLIRQCGVPIVPVMNFTTTDGGHRGEWENLFKKEMGAFAFTSFDAWVHSIIDELRLLDNMKSVLQNGAKHHKAAIDWWRDSRYKASSNRRADALRAVAEFAIDLAAFRRKKTDVNRADVETKKAMLKQELETAVNERHAQMLREISKLYHFDADQKLPRAPFECVESDLDKQLFEVTTPVAIGAGGGLATGTAIGATIDLATGGMTLGLGTIIGAAVGGIIGGGGGATIGRAIDFHYDNVARTIMCRTELSKIGLLAWQGLKLASDLAQRGVANEKPLKLVGEIGKVDQARWSAVEKLLGEVRDKLAIDTTNYCEKDKVPAPFPKWRDRLIELLDEIWDKDLNLRHSV